MNSNKKNRRRSWFASVAGALLIGLLLTGCKGVPTKGEREARRQLSAVAKIYRPGDHPARPPELTTNSPLGDFLTYAMFNEPQVRAAYFDWAASVENITVARSLPDPQLTFQMDIQDIVTSIMPGLMQEFPGPGKLRVRGDVASADSQARYFIFENTVLQTADAVKQSYYQIWFLDEKIRVDRQLLQLLAEAERVARAKNAAGLATLQDVYDAQIAEDRMRTDIANLEDSRRPLIAQFKAALGLTPDQPDPPLPGRFEPTVVNLSPEQLLATAYARNPQLKVMAAEVQQAEASLELAYKTRVPNFHLGLMADAKMAPVLYRPLAGMSLPIWRDKISAEIAAAQAGKRAAAARLTAAQIVVAVAFAEKSFDYRLALRNLALFDDFVIPKARQSLEIARASYLANTVDYSHLVAAEQAPLNYELSAIEARQQRELALTDLSLLIAGVPPKGAPVFPGGATGRSISNKISKLQTP
ncbi:MAG: TolC family protein [Verrucomicrobiota bacterium]|nr:TolC family protein [Verrucomicrobiota bacterium]